MKAEGKSERTGKPVKSKEELMAIRRGIKKKTPKFLRQEWFRKKHRLGKKWRKPRGIHSKLREHEVARGALPHPGYGSPSAVRGLDRRGHREILVRNLKEMERIKHKEEIAVIAGVVGKRKRLEMLAFAAKNNIRVGNRKKII